MTDIVFITDPCLWDGKPFTIGAWHGHAGDLSHRCGEIVCPVGPVPMILRVKRWQLPLGLQTLAEETFSGTLEQAEARLRDMIAKAYAGGEDEKEAA